MICFIFYPILGSAAWTFWRRTCGLHFPTAAMLQWDVGPWDVRVAIARIWSSKLSWTCTMNKDNRDFLLEKCLIWHWINGDVPVWQWASLPSWSRNSNPNSKSVSCQDPSIPAGSGAAAAKHQRQMKHCDGGDEPTVCWPNKKHPVLLYGCFQK